MLNALEARLGVTDTGYPALVFYQLRTVVAVGPRAHRAVRSGPGAQAGRAGTAATSRRGQPSSILTAPGRGEAVAQRRIPGGRRGESGRRARSRARASHAILGNYFKQRALEQRINSTIAGAVAANATLADARAAAEELDKEPTPEFPGLSLESRACHQPCGDRICPRRFACGSPRTRLVTLAREGHASGAKSRTITVRSPSAKHSCVRLKTPWAAIQGRANIAQEISSRTDRPTSRLCAIVDPPIPHPRQTRSRSRKAIVLTNEPVGVSAARMPNVLAEDTWDLFRILLR